jgi:hypothetical protein
VLFIFRAYAKNTTTLLGTLSEAANKGIRVHYNGFGEGSFEINRHSSQASWAAAGNYIRVHIGNIFTDPVFGFFIGQGEDVTVSQDEEGGEVLTRGGPGALSYITRAIIDPTGGNARYSEGIWRWTDSTMGEIAADLIDDAQARGALPRLTRDFSASTDSNGASWDTFDGTYDLNVGMQLDEAVGRLQSAGFIARMSHDFVLSAYKTIGTDRSGTITFEKGVNITADGQREIFASPAKSDMLVQGQTKQGTFKFVWATDSAVRTALGERIEGFTSYQSTASDTVLGRVGAQAIKRLKKRRDGLSQLGVLETTWVPFVHYFPGDTVNVNIPGEFDNVHAVVTAIGLKDDEAGNAEVALEFEDIAFEPLQLNDKTDPTQSPSSGGSGGGGATVPDNGRCDDCPPYTPIADTTVPDLVLPLNAADTTPLTSGGWSAIIQTTQTGTTLLSWSGSITPERDAFYIKQFCGVGCCNYPSGSPTFTEQIMALTYGVGTDYNTATVHIVARGTGSASHTQSAKMVVRKGNWGSGSPTATGTGLITIPIPLDSDGLTDTAGTDVVRDFSFSFANGIAQLIYMVDTSGVMPGAQADGYDDCVVTGITEKNVPVIPEPDQEYSILLGAVNTSDLLNSTITFQRFLPPTSGQVLPSEHAAQGDGTTTTFTAAHPYMPGSLSVTVNSVDWTNEITSSNPATGSFTLSHAPKPDSDIIVTYRAA